MTFDHGSSTHVRLGYRFSAVPEWVTFHSDLTGEQVRLYAVFCRYAHDQAAWPSIESLVEKTGRSESSIKRDIRQLQKVGAIHVEERFDDTGRQTSNLYHLAGDAPFTREPKLWGEGFTAEPHEGSTAEPQTRTIGTRDVSPSGDTRAGSPMTVGLFEAFFEFWMGRPYESGVLLPKSARGRLNRAVREAWMAGITAEEVVERGGLYRKLWPKLERTPQALLANWARFEAGAAELVVESRVDPSPPRNDPAACLHRAVTSAGECAGCNTQVAYWDDDGLRWLPGKAPPGADG